MNRTDAQPSEVRELLSCVKEAKTWLFEQAAPLWSTAGWRVDGMFAEELTMDAKALPTPRRLRVQARQIYSFCLIGQLGWSGPWREKASVGLDFLLRRGRRSDGLFGHTFSNVGILLDERADLYDHAFILLCFAQAAESLGRSELLDEAETLQDKIVSSWRHSNGGFSEGEVVGPPRRQNPHMHLLEAAMALRRVSGKRRWAQLANEIASLCQEYFIESKTGALTEYFSDDWSPMSGETGRIVEPGHCFEWSWLFESKGTDPDLKFSDRLSEFARSFGIDRARGSAVNEVLVNGTVRDAGVRLWPQTERMRCALARYQRTNDPDEANEAILAFRGLLRHFETVVPGLWRERFSSESGWITQPAPASSMYHIVGAITELVRATDNV